MRTGTTGVTTKMDPGVARRRLPVVALAVGLVVGLVLALAGRAGADAAAREISGKDVRAIGGGYQLYFGGHRGGSGADGWLHVRKGKRSAPLEIGGLVPRATQPVSVKVAGKTVTLAYLPQCEDVEVTYSHDQLAARLELEEGARLVAKGQRAAAEKLLARAAALDPGWDRAARELASARLQLGRPDDAAAALATRLAANPLGEYFRVALDPRLAPLVERPALVKLRAAVAGTARIEGSGSDGLVALPGPGVARAPSGALAFLESIGSHGACWQSSSLVIRDGKTLAELAAAPLVLPGDYDGDGCAQPALSAEGKARIQARAAVATQLLAALGFSPLEGEVMTANEEVRPGVNRLRFGKSGLGLVVGSDGAARLFQGGKLLVEHPPGSVYLPSVTAAALIPGEQRLFFWRWWSGCEHEEGSDVFALPLQ